MIRDQKMKQRNKQISNRDKIGICVFIAIFFAPAGLIAFVQGIGHLGTDVGNALFLIWFGSIWLLLLAFIWIYILGIRVKRDNLIKINLLLSKLYNAAIYVSMGIFLLSVIVHVLSFFNIIFPFQWVIHIILITMGIAPALEIGRGKEAKKWQNKMPYYIQFCFFLLLIYFLFLFLNKNQLSIGKAIYSQRLASIIWTAFSLMFTSAYSYTGEESKKRREQLIALSDTEENEYINLGLNKIKRS